MKPNNNQISNQSNTELPNQGNLSNNPHHNMHLKKPSNQQIHFQIQNRKSNPISNKPLDSSYQFNKNKLKADLTGQTVQENQKNYNNSKSIQRQNQITKRNNKIVRDSNEQQEDEPSKKTYIKRIGNFFCGCFTRCYKGTKIQKKQQALNQIGKGSERALEQLQIALPQKKMDKTKKLSNHRDNNEKNLNPHQNQLIKQNQLLKGIVLSQLTSVKDSEHIKTVKKYPFAEDEDLQPKRQKYKKGQKETNMQNHGQKKDGEENTKGFIMKILDYIGGPNRLGQEKQSEKEKVIQESQKRQEPIETIEREANQEVNFSQIVYINNKRIYYKSKQELQQIISKFPADKVLRVKATNSIIGGPSERQPKGKEQQKLKQQQAIKCPSGPNFCCPSDARPQVGELDSISEKNISREWMLPLAIQPTYNNDLDYNYQEETLISKATKQQGGNHKNKQINQKLKSNKACVCRKRHCLKACACYQNNRRCTSRCKCFNCHNKQRQDPPKVSDQPPGILQIFGPCFQPILDLKFPEFNFSQSSGQKSDTNPNGNGIINSGQSSKQNGVNSFYQKLRHLIDPKYLEIKKEEIKKSGNSNKSSCNNNKIKIIQQQQKKGQNIEYLFDK